MLLIYSGGLDSTTLLYEYKREIKLAVNFHYGSKHNDRERGCAEVNTTRLNIPLIKMSLEHIKGYFTSSLLQGGEPIPEGHYEDPNMRETVVPFRNGIMLAVACGLAESRGINKVMYATHSGDHTIYPDCRPGFVESFGEAMKKGTYAGVELITPYIALNKREIALRGKGLGVYPSATYTCYNGRVKHCGKCGACVERKEALNGFDNTEYEDV